MRGTPVRFDDFRKGLNTAESAYLLSSGEARDCFNVVSTVRGSLKARPGMASLSSSGFTNTPTTLYGFDPPDASARVMLAAEGGRIYKIAAGGGAATSLATGLTAGNPWEFATFASAPGAGAASYIFALNGAATPQYWNGSSSSTSNWVAASGSVPNGTMMAVWGDRLWISGVAGYPSRVYCSNLGNPFDWNTITLDCDPMDGESITGLGTIGPYLIVFKESKSYIVYDYDATYGPIKRQLSNNIGCCSHRSIVETPRGTFFLTADRGVWRTNGSTVEEISQRVRPSMIPAPGLRSRAVGAYYRDHYYLSFASNNGLLVTNDVLYDYDIELGSWWKHSNAVRDFSLWAASTSTDEVELYGIREAIFNSVAPGIDKMFAPSLTTDLGAAINCQWTGPWHAFNAPYIKKRLRRVTFDGSGVFSAYLARDFDSAWTPYATLDLSGALTATGLFAGTGNFAPSSGGVTFGASTASSTLARVYGVGSTGVGRALSIKFEGASTYGFEVDSYTMNITGRKN